MSKESGKQVHSFLQQNYTAMFLRRQLPQPTEAAT
jgi:hypothetical protein